MLVRTPNSVDYSTPRIDSNNVRENSNAVGVGVNTALPTDTSRLPRTRSVGNNVQYLVGDLVTTAIVSVGEVIGILPATQAAFASGKYVCTNFSGAANVPIIIEIVGNEILAGNAFVITDTISLDGIVYLSE